MQQTKNTSERPQQTNGPSQLAKWILQRHVPLGFICYCKRKRFNCSNSAPRPSSQAKKHANCLWGSEVFIHGFPEHSGGRTFVFKLFGKNRFQYVRTELL